MSRDIVLDYLGSVSYKDWSIISVLRYIESKQELYADAIDSIKEDIYAVFRSYEKGESICKNAKKKLNKILSTYEKSFLTAEVSKFKNNLRCEAEAEEHKVALRMKHTSACTIEELKGFHANKRVINQLMNGDDNGVSEGEADDTEEDVEEADDTREEKEKDDKEEDDEEREEQEKKAGDVTHCHLESRYHNNREGWDRGDNGINKHIRMTIDERHEDRIDSCNKISDSGYKEFVEGRAISSRRRSWILQSGTDVGNVLEEYAATIPDSQRCLNLAYWNIIDLTDNHSEVRCLFSANDWEEMVGSFDREVRLEESEISDGFVYFFDELKKLINIQEENNLVSSIEHILPESIENTYSVNLDTGDRDDIAIIRRAVSAYVENLQYVDLPVSEAAFDNMFTNMLLKRFLDPKELKMDVGEVACWASATRRNVGRSVLLRARIGQKCDFRGTLKHSIDNLEALIGLRSGGLPEAPRLKVFEDRIDLAVSLRDVICQFFARNSNASDDKLHETFVVGMQSWDEAKSE